MFDVRIWTPSPMVRNSRKKKNLCCSPSLIKFISYLANKLVASLAHSNVTAEVQHSPWDQRSVWYSCWCEPEQGKCCSSHTIPWIVKAVMHWCLRQALPNKHLQVISLESLKITENFYDGLYNMERKQWPSRFLWSSFPRDVRTPDSLMGTRRHCLTRR